MIPDRWKTWKLAGKWVFAVLFIVAGILHFVRPEFYLKIMPPYLPWHRELVFVSGVIEMILGVLLLIPATSAIAAWGLIALLIAIFPANIHAYLHQELIAAPPWLHLLRLPLQGVLILWAYAYTGQRGRAAARKLSQTSEV
jgi:uncharacterized membrane protein